MDSDWQEVLFPPSSLVVFERSTGQFTPDYLNQSGLCHDCPCSRRLTSRQYKVRQIQLSPPNLNHYAHIIATIAFDTHQELLWVGDDYVSFSSITACTAASDMRPDRL